MKPFTPIFAVAGMASTALGHGFITSPKPRMPGAAMEAACGQQVYDNQEGSYFGNIQNMLQVAATQTDYNAAACNIWMCKGYKYADNTANVQTFTAGQVLPMTFEIQAPHTGVANISVVRTSDNTVIGAPLISWDVFASTAVPAVANQSSFSVTLPSDLGDACTTAGACVLQHYWNAASVDQTYESCVDFTMADSGTGEAVASPSTTPSAVHVTSTVHVASTSTTTPVTTTAPPASTCACTALARRDETICETIETRTIVETTTETHTLSSSIVPVTSTLVVSPANATISIVTVTETSTATETTTVSLTGSSAGVSVAAISATTSSANCTTSITLRGTGTGTGLPFKHHNGTGIFPLPTGTGAVSVNPAAISSLIANITSALPAATATTTGGALVSPGLLSSLIGNLTSALPTGALTATGTGIPTAVPSGLNPTAPITPSTPVPSGYSLEALLDWVAYLIGLYDAETGDTAPTFSPTSTAAAVKRGIVPRGFRG